MIKKSSRLFVLVLFAEIRHAKSTCNSLDLKHKAMLVSNRKLRTVFLIFISVYMYLTKSRRAHAIINYYCCWTEIYFAFQTWRKFGIGILLKTGMVGEIFTKNVHFRELENTYRTFLKELKNIFFNIDVNNLIDLNTPKV